MQVDEVMAVIDALGPCITTGRPAEGCGDDARVTAFPPGDVTDRF